MEKEYFTYSQIGPAIFIWIVICLVRGGFKTFIHHRITSHEHEKLVIHRKILHENSGKSVRQELYFGYIPSDLKQNGPFRVIHSN